MGNYYEMTIAGCKRSLPLCKISDTRAIAGFVIFGDVELTQACATELLKKAPEYDYMIAPEAKAIPLIYEMARQTGQNEYFLIRKAPKLYMEGVFSHKVKSITTAKEQEMFMDGKDAKKMAGKRILLLDDVISTGESMVAMEDLVNKAGGVVVGRMAILAEGDAAKRDDIIFLEKLPLFDQDFKPID